MKSNPLAAGSIVLQRYEIIERIGSGGYGMVYRAKQLNTGQSVAIKVLLSHHQEEEAQLEVKRFQREMQLIARLSHPNIVQLKDSGKIGPDLAMVLEYVEGEELGRIVKSRGPLALTIVKRIFIQVLEALSEAHRHGIVHRDLKPANIMLTGSRERPVAKILDFGIAAVTHEAPQDWERLTETGVVLGTAAFMAPEQLMRNQVSPSCDLYALGLIMLETLTGERAVQGETGMEVAVKQLTEEIFVPPQLLHSPLGTFILRACAKEASARFASAEEMLAELESIDLNGRPASSPLNTPLTTERPLSASPNLATGTLLPPSTRTKLREQLPAASPAKGKGLMIGIAVALFVISGAIIAVLLLPKEGQSPAPTSPATQCQDFKAEDQVSSCREACEAGALEGCTRLAYLYEYGVGLPQNTAAAARFYQQSCDQDELRACRQLAFLFIEGAGVPKDAERARQLLQAAHVEGDLAAALGLGQLYHTADGVEYDLEQALKHFDTLCMSASTELQQESMDARQAARACWEAAQIYSLDKERPVDLKRAAAYWAQAAQWLEPACSAGDPVACSELATVLEQGKLDEGGRALALYQQACEQKNAAACFTLGARYAKGKGVERDVDKAVALFQGACDAQLMMACNNLGFMFRDGAGVNRDLKRAAGYFRAACDGEALSGCLNLAVLYYQGNGVGQDYSRALSLFERSCDGGYQQACTYLGTMLQNGEGVDRDLARAQKLHKQACEADEMLGCYALAKVYAAGLGVAPDPSRARQLYERACMNGQRHACLELISMAEAGLGGPVSFELAARARGRACESGLEDLCEPKTE